MNTTTNYNAFDNFLLRSRNFEMLLIVLRAVQYGFVEHYNRTCRTALAQEFDNIEDSCNGDSNYYYYFFADMYFMCSYIWIGLIISLVVFAGEIIFKKYNSNVPVKINCREYENIVDL